MHNIISGTKATNIRGPKDLSEPADRDGAEDYEYDEYDEEYDDEYDYGDYSSSDTFGKYNNISRTYIYLSS